MNVKQLIESVRHGGAQTEKEFIELTKDINGKKRVEVTRGSTRINYLFNFNGSKARRFTQTPLLRKLVGLNEDEIKSLDVSVKISDRSKFFKSDFKALEDIPNFEGDRYKWKRSGVKRIKKGELIEVKKARSLYAKVMYAESFKFATKKNIEEFNNASYKVKEKFNEIVDKIILELEKYIHKEHEANEIIRPKEMPGYIVVKGVEWSVKRIFPEDFWRELKVKKIIYSGAPRIEFYFKQTPKKITESIELLKNDKEVGDLEAKLIISFDIMFEDDQKQKNILNIA